MRDRLVEIPPRLGLICAILWMADPSWLPSIDWSPPNSSSLPQTKMTDFSTLNLCPALKLNLARNGFVTPTPVQAQSIPPALEGRDIVATAQTGTGKTLAFALPIVDALAKVKPSTSKAAAIQAVILSPTRELALQINEAIALLTMGTQVRSAAVVGGMNEANQLKNIRKGAQIVVATPGRLCDFLDRRLVDLRSVTMVVLDEADRMLDMGFLPSIQEILSALPTSRQTMLFSATVEKSVQHLIEGNVRNPARINIGNNTKPAEQVDLHHYEVEQNCKLGLLTHLLKQEPGAVLVFARTKRGTDKLAKSLANCGVRTARIHGDRTQAQRNQALAGFKDGSYRVLVATDVAARGIHVDGIAHVVNFDLPQIPEDLIHRVGRTGRAGAKGVASTFSTRAERSEMRHIEQSLKVKMIKQEVPMSAMQEVKASAQPVDLDPPTRAYQPAVHHRPAAKKFGSGFGAKRPAASSSAGGHHRPSSSSKGPSGGSGSKSPSNRGPRGRASSSSGSARY